MLNGNSRLLNNSDGKKLNINYTMLKVNNPPNQRERRELHYRTLLIILTLQYNKL